MIAPPVLRSIDPRRVSVFLKEIDGYELDVASKQSELSSLRVTPYTSSIERTTLRSALLFGKLDDIVPGVTDATLLAKEQIESYIRNLVSLDAGTYINS